MRWPSRKFIRIAQIDYLNYFVLIFANEIKCGYIDGHCSAHSFSLRQLLYRQNLPNVFTLGKNRGIDKVIYHVLTNFYDVNGN
jgi:hypothetical protein